MRSRALCRGKISPRCVPGRQSVAIFSLHASQKGPRTGKSPLPGKIRTPCIRKRAGSGKICALCMIWGSRTGKGTLRGKIIARCIPKWLFVGLIGYTVCKSCQNQRPDSTFQRNFARIAYFPCASVQNSEISPCQSNLFRANGCKLPVFCVKPFSQAS